MSRAIGPLGHWVHSKTLQYYHNVAKSFMKKFQSKNYKHLFIYISGIFWHCGCFDMGMILQKEFCHGDFWRHSQFSTGAETAMWQNIPNIVYGWGQNVYLLKSLCAKMSRVKKSMCRIVPVIKNPCAKTCRIIPVLKSPWCRKVHLLECPPNPSAHLYILSTVTKCQCPSVDP